jgi:tryptophan halogenase
MSRGVTRVVALGSGATLWLAAGTVAKALAPAGVTVEAVELPSVLKPADVQIALPPLEALHNQLGIDESALLRATGGSFSLGQNFADTVAGTPAFLHAYGSAGAAIDGHDFFAYWLKARHFGLAVGLEDFSLAAAAARHGRLMIPDDETEIYGRSDYGYHLPALAYAASLKQVAIRHGVIAHQAATAEAALDPETGAILALALDNGRRVEGELFLDCTGPEAALIRAMGVARESWRAHFPADSVLMASGPSLESIPVYAEIRAGARGWTGLFPSRARTHVVHAFSTEQSSDEEALSDAGGVSLADAVVRPSDPGRRERAWERNCVAIGEAACVFDPAHGVALHAVQLGLVQLLASFPSGPNFAAQRAEYNRVVAGSFERVRDFQAAHYALNRYGDSPFWTRARQALRPAELAHRIALFEARGEIAPMEEESFAPDSWRALLIGHGLAPESWLPVIDRTGPEEMKAQFRRMLGFVKEQMLRQPTHDAYLARLHG